MQSRDQSRVGKILTHQRAKSRTPPLSYALTYCKTNPVRDEYKRLQHTCIQRGALRVVTTKYTIRDSIIISLMSLIGGALVNSQLLVEWANRMEFGSVREYALSATQSVHTIATDLHLNKPQAHLQAKVGEWRSQSFSTTFFTKTQFRVSVRNTKPTKGPIRTPIQPSPRAMLSVVNAPKTSPSHFIAMTFGSLRYDMLTHKLLMPRQPLKVSTETMAQNSADKAQTPIIKSGSTKNKSQSLIKQLTVSTRGSIPPTTQPSGSSKHNDRKPNVLIVGDSLMGR